MKIKLIILSVSITLLLSFIGCGGTDDTPIENQAQKTTQETLQLNEDNYLNLARHYYSQNSLTKVVIPRNMQHLSQSKINKDRSIDKNSFYIKSNTSADGTIESMIISKGDKLISVSIDNGSVKVSLHSDEKVIRQTLSLDAFKNFDM